MRSLRRRLHGFQTERNLICALCSVCWRLEARNVKRAGFTLQMLDCWSPTVVKPRLRPSHVCHTHTHIFTHYLFPVQGHCGSTAAVPWYRSVGHSISGRAETLMKKISIRLFTRSSLRSLQNCWVNERLNESFQSLVFYLQPNFNTSLLNDELWKAMIGGGVGQVSMFMVGDKVFREEDLQEEGWWSLTCVYWYIIHHIYHLSLIYLYWSCFFFSVSGHCHVWLQSSQRGWDDVPERSADQRSQQGRLGLVERRNQRHGRALPD